MMLSCTRKFGWFAAVAIGAALLMAHTASAQPVDPAGKKAAKAAAQEALEHETGGDPNPLAFRTDLALWTFVVFVVLFGLLSYFAWPQISAALDERERKIAETIAAADARLADAKAVLADHEAKLAAAAGEVRALLEEARRDAEHTRKSIEEKGRQSAKEELDRAIREVERAKDGAIQELATQSANVAVDLARQIIRQQLTPDQQSRIVRDALDKFSAVNPSKN